MNGKKLKDFDVRINYIVVKTWQFMLRHFELYYSEYRLKVATSKVSFLTLSVSEMAWFFLQSNPVENST